jgi:hypothetical protein
MKKKYNIILIGHSGFVGSLLKKKYEKIYEFTFLSSIDFFKDNNSEFLKKKN